jgi:hypothetical protein
LQERPFDARDVDLTGYMIHIGGIEMKQRFGIFLVVLLALSFATHSGYAQLEENLGGLTEDNLDGYLGPLNTALSGTMNSAVFKTGFVPQTGLTFTIGVAAMAVGFDSEDETYLPTDPPGFTSLEETPVPTVVGDPAGKTVEGENNLAQIYPGGFDLSGFEIAVPQLTIGSVYGTRAIIRYIALDVGDADVGDFTYFGFGGQHSISQWFETLPVDLAAGLFFQSFEIGDVMKAKTTQFNVTASKAFGVVEPYIGLGFDAISTNVEYTDDDNPEFSFDVDLDTESNAHLTLGAMAKVSGVGAFFEFNAAAAAGFALGLEFGI